MARACVCFPPLLRLFALWGSLGASCAHSGSAAWAETLRVPDNHATLRAALGAARAGDVVLAAPGRYAERVVIPANVTLRSAGDDAPGELGLKRAEAAVLDGGGDQGDEGDQGGQPGVALGEGAVLDGFTVTNVGRYDEALWRKHFESQGEELGDDEGAAAAEGATPAIRAAGVNCAIVNNIVHHNGDVGVAVIGAKGQRVTPLVAANRCYRNLGGGVGVAEGADAVVRDNVCHENLRAGVGCRAANPLIVGNTCFENIRAGIGCREGARPIVRGNVCRRNRRAGVGARMEGTAPIIEGNECLDNDMAGVGCRDGAAPIIRGNLCRGNKMAGVGADGARPLIVDNTCEANHRAGIGLRGGAQALIENNRCFENKLVAIGVTEGARATIRGNTLRRAGGPPPLVAILDGSTALLFDNELVGGGVAAVLVEGTATLRDNTLRGAGERQGVAVAAWGGATIDVAGNRFDGYEAAVSATKAKALVHDNVIANFRGVAITLRDGAAPPRVFGNTAYSKDAQAKVVAIQGAAGFEADNTLKTEEP